MKSIKKNICPVVLMAASMLVMCTSCTSHPKSDNANAYNDPPQENMSGTSIPRDTTNPTIDSLNGQIASFKKTWNKKMDDLNKEITLISQVPEQKSLRSAHCVDKRLLVVSLI